MFVSATLVTLMLATGQINQQAEGVVLGIREQMDLPVTAYSPLYPGGKDVECTIAIVFAKFLGGPENGWVDPILRDSIHGDLDCSREFKAARMSFKRYHGKGTHYYMTRPLQAKDGRPAIWQVAAAERSVTEGNGYFVDYKNGTWVVGEAFEGEDAL